MPSLAEQLTAQFYEWEALGRGWMLYEEPIHLEPPFTPFFGHFLRRQELVDDGLHHTLLSKAASLFTKKPKVKPISYEPVVDISYSPYIFDDDTPLTTFKIVLPKNSNIGVSETEQFLTMLSYCTSPMSFELIGASDKIFIYFNCRETYASYLKSQLATYFPEINVIEETNNIKKFLAEDADRATVDFGLKEEFMRPLAQNTKGHMDSFKGIFSTLENLAPEEKIVIQVLFNGVINPWGSSILRSVSNGNKGPFFENSPEMLSMAKEKISSPLFAVTIRAMTQAETLNKAFELLKVLTFSITTASRSSGNVLTPYSDEEYTFDQRINDIFFCESHRSGMLLNVKELANFVHLPNIASKKLSGIDRKTKAAPETNGSFLLGLNEHNGITKPVSLSNEQRLRHTYIVGATGTGKSNLLLNMIKQDIEAGNGIAVLDPHGDLIENILQLIPEKRIQDVVLLDPSNTGYPLSFNILHAHSEIEKEVLCADLVATFRRLSTSWGDQMNSVLANAILAILESSKGGTLIDLRRFLIEKDYRSNFLKTVNDLSIQYYWQKEYHLLKTNSIGPILTRLDSFLRSRIIRNMVAQKKGLDFENILNTKKILLVKLSEGLIGEENSYMIGTFIVSKIHQAALARQALQVRKDFFLYVDEFQHFMTPSMISILSGTRKYHVGLILAHQDLEQLPKDDKISNAVLNAVTRICFRVGDKDAKRLAEGFSFFESQDLQNLSIGEAIVRIEKSQNDFSLSTAAIILPDNKRIIERIIIASREKYCTPKDIVESQLFTDLNFQEEKILPPPAAVFKTESVPAIKNEPVEDSKPVEASKPVEPLQSLADNKTVERIVKKKEESQHRYLQNLIKKMAEARGYKATIEAAIPNAKEKVDVLLESQKHTIACEISITTDAAWEMHNIQKCLTAGYDIVVSCQPDPKILTLFQKKATEIFSKEEMAKIKFFSPETLFTYLDEITVAGMETETMIKGYRVKVSYDAITPEEMGRKREAVAKVVADSINKMKK